MNDARYNGWTNYETWRVNLEFCDDGALEHYTNPDELRDHVTSYIEEQATGVALDYALSFLSSVNWHEIASHQEEEKENEEE